MTHNTSPDMDEDVLKALVASDVELKGRLANGIRLPEGLEAFLAEVANRGVRIYLVEGDFKGGQVIVVHPEDEQNLPQENGQPYLGDDDSGFSLYDIRITELPPVIKLIQAFKPEEPSKEIS
jgi:hypothetical protein